MRRVCVCLLCCWQAVLGRGGAAGLRGCVSSAGARWQQRWRRRRGLGCRGPRGAAVRLRCGQASSSATSKEGLASCSSSSPSACASAEMLQLAAARRAAWPRPCRRRAAPADRGAAPRAPTATTTLSCDPSEMHIVHRGNTCFHVDFCQTKLQPPRCNLAPEPAEQSTQSGGSSSGSGQ